MNPVSDTPMIQGGTADVDFSRQNHAPTVPNVPGGLSPGELHTLNHYRKTIDAVRADGFTFSPEVDNALDVVTSVRGYRLKPDPPAVAGKTPDEVISGLDAFISAKARQGVATDCRALVLSNAVTALLDALRGDLGPVLDHYRDGYRQAVDAYLSGHDTVTAYATVADLAEHDYDGSRIAAYHRAKDGAKEAERIVGLVLGLITEKPQQDRFFDTAIGLMMDPGTVKDITPVAYASDALKKGTVNGTAFGRLPLIAATGARMELPTSAEEWGDRIEAYRGLSQSALAGLFRDDE